MGNLIDGKTIRMGGNEYVVPPLTFKQLRALTPKLDIIASIPDGKMPDDEQMQAMIDVVHSALSRNYPDVTAEAVEDMIDLGNVQPIIAAIMGVSGLLEPGEARAGS